MFSFYFLLLFLSGDAFARLEKFINVILFAHRYDIM